MSVEEKIEQTSLGLSGNSFSERNRKEQNKVEKRVPNGKVVNGKVVLKEDKKRKFMDVFSLSDLSKVRDSVIFDVLIPAAKKMLVDMVENGIYMFIYGDSRRPTPPGSSVVPATKIGYTNYARPIGSYSDSYNAPQMARMPRSVHSYDQVVFETRSDAMSVLDVLDNIAGEYNIVRVADLYDAAGITKFDYTANNFGWRESDISSAKIERVREGYIINLPKPLNIN